MELLLQQFMGMMSNHFEIDLNYIAIGKTFKGKLKRDEPVDMNIYRLNEWKKK